MENIYPWARIWTQPRKTIRALIEKAPREMIIWLALIQGVISGFYWIDPIKAEFPTLHIALTYILCIVIGAIYGIVELYLVAWLYTFCGKWMGGSGTYQEVKCAVGWSFYPFIISGLFGLFSYYAVPNPWFQGIIGLISTVAFIWGLVILFQLVGEAHHISAWRALASVFIALAIVIGVFFVLSFILGLFLR